MSGIKQLTLNSCWFLRKVLRKEEEMNSIINLSKELDLDYLTLNYSDELLVGHELLDTKIIQMISGSLCNV